MRAAARILAAACAAAALAAVLGGCGAPPDNILGVSTQPSEIQKLQKVEIRSYRGKQLDSIAALRENSIKGPQHVDLNTYKLAVTGAGIPSPASFTYAQITALPSYEKEVTLYCVEGWSADLLWQGVKISDILAKASYDASRTSMGSKPVTVIFHCTDGYTTSLPLAFVEKNDILLAYKENGVDLPERYGFPFQVVAEAQSGYKWAKWVTGIELSTDPDYRGYWEQRGYPIDAPVGK
jgi:DMSO/TMAO reductase YedYZ molybdopterin-dependent catalytic subunit